MNARRLIPTLASIAILAAMTPATGLGARNDSQAQVVGDITHVANVPWGARGSDLEFASREVTKLSEGATGDPVCATDAEGACLVDENGETIYETEVRDFAVAGVYGDGRIVDITDPRNPVVVTLIPCRATQHDVQVQGDLLLVAQDGGTGTCTRPDGSTQGFNGSAVLDFSDPRNPTYLSRLQYARGSHNHTAHPTQPYVYLSDSDLNNTGLGNIPIWDVSDPANPTMVREFKHLAHSPHDITFNADGTRAYAAAVTATYILNTEDPRAPELIATIANEGISISHQSDPTPDGKFLLVSDELGGGSVPGASPSGPVHVYDIRDEAHPVKVGLIENDCVVVACEDGTPVHTTTSHVFRINPDGYTMAIGWYHDGVHVIDYSGIRGANAAGSGGATHAGARTLASIKMPGANTWTAKMWQERHPGYVFANDARGLDVFYMPELDNGYLAYGTISVGHPANYEGRDTGITRTEWESECDYTPRTNGVDGWVTRIPAEYADGTHTLRAEGQGPGFDLELYLYDKDCALLGKYENSGTDETGEILEGAAYVMVANYAGTSNTMVTPVHVRLSVS